MAGAIRICGMFGVLFVSCAPGAPFRSAGDAPASGGAAEFRADSDRPRSPDTSRRQAARDPERADDTIEQRAEDYSLRVVELSTASIRVWLEPERHRLPETRILRWVRDAGRAVERYYGRFPVRDARIRIDAALGSELGQARAILLGKGPLITIELGQEVSSERLEHDWRMTHEMVHLAFPNVPRRHLWIEEGLATFVEPIARARLGLYDETDVWKEWIRAMPQGQPGSGDLGLDYTPTWGRTYWGGALFALLADVEIRKRSDGELGLEHGLRAIVVAGGSMNERWPLERALAVADRATGFTVLGDHYRAMRAAPITVDLPRLWQDLGVRLEGNRVIFDDDAPLAAIRKGMIVPAAPRDGEWSAALAEPLRAARPSGSWLEQSTVWWWAR